MAVTVTKDQVLALAPELSTLTDAQWNLVVADVQAEVAVDFFSSPARAGAAAVWLGAHLGTILKRGGSATAGQAQSITVGPITKTFANSGARSSASVDLLKSTSYGQEYLRRVGHNLSAFVV